MGIFDLKSKSHLKKACYKSCDKLGIKACAKNNAKNSVVVTITESKITVFQNLLQEYEKLFNLIRVAYDLNEDTDIEEIEDIINVVIITHIQQKYISEQQSFIEKFGYFKLKDDLDILKKECITLWTWCITFGINCLQKIKSKMYINQDYEVFHYLINRFHLIDIMLAPVLYTMFDEFYNEYNDKHYIKSTCYIQTRMFESLNIKQRDIARQVVGIQVTNNRKYVLTESKIIGSIETFGCNLVQIPYNVILYFNTFMIKQYHSLLNSFGKSFPRIENESISDYLSKNDLCLELSRDENEPFSFYRGTILQNINVFFKNNCNLFSHKYKGLQHTDEDMAYYKNIITTIVNNHRSLKQKCAEHEAAFMLLSLHKTNTTE